MATVQNAEFRWTRGTEARWAQVNPILGSGEPGYEVDTRRFKVGDGFTAWNALGYASEATLDGNNVDPRIGDLTQLTTDVVGTLVGAINEVNTPLILLTALYDNAKAG